MPLNFITTTFLDFLFPPTCLVCQKELGADDQFEAVCDYCFLSIRELSHQFRALKPLDRVVFYGSYADPILHTLIYSFKYHGVKGLGKPLGELQARALEEAGVGGLWYGSKPLITFIPLHPLKERLRGYNQSLLLASYLGTHFSLPVLPLLRRRWITPAQASLKHEKERKENIKGSFELLIKMLPQKIIVVDDVLTSGATLKEAGRLLRNAGVKTLWGVVVAGRGRERSKKKKPPPKIDGHSII